MFMAEGNQRLDLTVAMCGIEQDRNYLNYCCVLYSNPMVTVKLTVIKTGFSWTGLDISD